MAKWLREPLLHFLLAGLALFLAAQWHSRRTDIRRIRIDAARIAQLRQAYEAEFGAPPPPAVLPKLIDDHVTSEVLFREGLARGLDRDDEIVRRRLIQKVQFLELDMAGPETPGEAELREWFARNSARYAVPGDVDFNHVFFAVAPGQDEAVRARAMAVRARLPSMPVTRAPELGDSFPDLADYRAMSPNEARRVFGDSEMARDLFHQPAGRWSMPLRSAYGWHLARVAKSLSARPARLEDVRERVLADFLEDSRAGARQRRLAELRARYTVVRE